MREARAAGPMERFYVTGVFPHPADIWTPPDEVHNTVWEEKEGLEGVMEGDIYIDGSCTTGPFKELRRAAFAVVAMKEDGQVTATASSPLWRSLPQTPQAAEYVALAAATQMVTGRSKIFCDCKNVVDDAQDLRGGARNGKKQHAGILRDILKYEANWKKIEEVAKVKAHQDISTIKEERERRRAIGNDHADASAKAALGRHPAQSRQEELILEAMVKKAKVITKLVAEVLPKWPAVRNRLQGRGEGGREETDRAPEEGRKLHQWEWIEQAWRCKRCLQCSFRSRMRRVLRNQRCEGETEESKIIRLKERHHTTARSTAVGLPLIFCLKCGAWTTRRMYKLAAACKAKRTRAGEQALGYIRNGLHPWLARGEKAEQRKAIGRGMWTPAEDGRAKRIKRRKVTEDGQREEAGGSKSKGEIGAGPHVRSGSSPRWEGYPARGPTDGSGIAEEVRAAAEPEHKGEKRGSYSYGGSESSGHSTALPLLVPEGGTYGEERTAPQRKMRRTGVEEAQEAEDARGISGEAQPKRRRLRGKQSPGIF